MKKKVSLINNFFLLFFPADPLPPLQHPPRLLPLWAARWSGWTQTALLPISMLAPLARPHAELQWWAGRRPAEVAKQHHADEEGTDGVQSGSRRVSTNWNHSEKIRRGRGGGAGGAEQTLKLILASGPLGPIFLVMPQIYATTPYKYIY